MSARQTNFPKNSTRSVHQGTTIIGKNGLAVDALASLEPGFAILNAVPSAVTYAKPTVTVAGSVDLTPLADYDDPKYSGTLLFTDVNGLSYVIDKDSINPIAGTFDIYNEAALQNSPDSIDNSAGWIATEGILVNRLQTTSQAFFETVEFRDVDIKLGFEGGDVFGIVDAQGDRLVVNPDGSINVVGDFDVVDIPVGAHTNQLFAENAYTITTANFEQIFSFNSTNNDTHVVIIECTAAQPCTFQLKINGVIKRILRSSPLERNIKFEFREPRNLANGTTVTVEARVERKFTLDPETFTAFEGYIAQ